MKSDKCINYIFHRIFRLRKPLPLGMGRSSRSSFPLCNKIIVAPFQQHQLFVADTIFDFRAIQQPKQERSTGTSAPYKALLTVIRYFVKQPESMDISGRLIAFSDPTFLINGFVELSVVMPHGTNQINLIRSQCRGVLSNTQSVIDMALLHVVLLS